MLVNHRVKERGARGFTLIELLAVVAILGIAFGIAVAALPGMTRGSAMRASTVELRSTLSLARQWAITHRENTYVVFADGGRYSVEKQAGERAFRGYAVYGEKSGFVSDWKFLKTGVYFFPERSFFPENRDEDDFNYTTYKNPFENAVGRGVLLPFPEAGDGIHPSEFPAVGFKPGGGVKGTGASTQEIYIGEGYMKSAVGRGEVKAGDLEFKPNTAITGFQLSGLTGAVKVRVYGEEGEE